MNLEKTVITPFPQFLEGERRVSPRFRVQWQAVALSLGSRSLRVTSLGTTGCFCLDPDPVPAGTSLLLEIELPGGRVPMILGGQVVRVSDNPKGIGVCFGRSQAQLRGVLREQSL